MTHTHTHAHTLQYVHVGLILVDELEVVEFQERSTHTRQEAAIVCAITMVASSWTSEVGELKAKVASLRRQLSDLQATGQGRSNWRT